MKSNFSFMVMLIAITILAGCGDRRYEVYLSPSGNDLEEGNKSHPIATLKRAQELAKIKAGKIPVTVYLEGGVYNLTEPLSFDQDDAGTKDAQVTWKAVEGEKPIISGGIAIENWNLESDGSWSAKLPNNLRTKFHSLYINDKRAIRARHPNKDYLRIDKTGEDRRTNFYFTQNDFPKPQNLTDLELVFLHDWSITRIGVISINWENNQLFTVDSIGARLPFFKIDNWEKQPRYYLENAKEFCDNEGEWYCDYLERKIYYRPKAGEELSATIGVIPISSQLIAINGDSSNHTKYINFEGIIFAHTEWKLPESGYCGIQSCMFTNRANKITGWDKVPAAIELNNVKNISFINCTIKHTGGNGIWIRENSSECEINDSHIYDIAGNGIAIGEGRDRIVNNQSWWKSVPHEVSKNNKVRNSIIENCGKEFYGAVGIWGGLVANTSIENNEVRNLPYTGISIGWMWDTTATPCKQNLIKGNHIHHLMNQLSDGGGIYSLGQQPGSRIVNNLIHDVTVNAGRAESNGIFLDEGTRDLFIENNIIYKIARSPLRFHKAFNNLVQKNVLVCGPDIPPIRYNRTKEENIRKVNNTLLKQLSEQDMDKLQLLVKKRIMEIGKKKNFN